MHVKTYTGSSTSQVLANIKAELGPDAVILETRENVQGEMTEILITAAVEREAGSYGDLPLGSGGRRNGDETNHMGWKNWQEEWGLIKSHLLALMKPELKLSGLTPRQRSAVEFLEQEGVCGTPLLRVYDSLVSDPEASVLSALSGMVKVKSWERKNWPQKIHLVTGPYGAGKTTALIRLALLLKKEMPQGKIWVVNADARRGGGRLLLKNYAQLCSFEYHEVANAIEFVQVLARARHDTVDAILVDLPGLPRGKSMPEMLDYFGMTDPDYALHLVVTPFGTEMDMQALVNRYAPGSLENGRSLVWTKLDEAVKFGVLVSVGSSSRMPISAFSCGPELNNTLVPAKEAALWRLLFKKEMPCPAGYAATGF